MDVEWIVSQGESVCATAGVTFVYERSKVEREIQVLSDPPDWVNALVRLV